MPCPRPPLAALMPDSSQATEPQRQTQARPPHQHQFQRLSSVHATLAKQAAAHKGNAQREKRKREQAETVLVDMQRMHAGKLRKLDSEAQRSDQRRQRNEQRLQVTHERNLRRVQLECEKAESQLAAAKVAQQALACELAACQLQLADSQQQAAALTSALQECQTQLDVATLRVQELGA